MRIIQSGKELYAEVKKLYHAYKENRNNSYWPDMPHKANAVILWELLVWFCKYAEINRYYYLYGFDIPDLKRNQSEYQDNVGFVKLRTRGNKNGSSSSQIGLLRDKYLFYKYMHMNHMPVPRVFAERINGEMLDEDLHPIEEDSLKKRTGYFAKAIDGECGERVERIHSYEELVTYAEKTEKTDFILQEPVTQHREMNRLNPCSVNTIRLVTVMKDGEPQVFGALLRIGTEKSGERDNTSQGGIAVRIHEDGSLARFGFRKPMYGGRTDRHPDTGVVFSEFTVPHYQEAVEMAFRAHRLFYRVRSIGWDIAITEEGPVFIEGNDNWKLQTFQAFDGGLREKCRTLLGD